MKLVLLIGAGAVGKMSVGQALMQKTGLRLFHNHMMIEPVIQVFGAYDGETVTALRRVIFEHFAKSANEGLIFTYMWAFDAPSDWAYIRDVARLFEDEGATVYCVELLAPQAVRLQRNATANRLQHKPSKRDQAFSRQCILHEDSNYRLVSEPGEIPFANYLRLENTDLSPEEAADRIIRHFGWQQASEKA